MRGQGHAVRQKCARSCTKKGRTAQSPRVPSMCQVCWLSMLSIILVEFWFCNFVQHTPTTNSNKLGPSKKIQKKIRGGVEAKPGACGTGGTPGKFTRSSRRQTPKTLPPWQGHTAEAAAAEVSGWETKGPAQGLLGALLGTGRGPFQGRPNRIAARDRLPQPHHSLLLRLTQARRTSRPEASRGTGSICNF